MINMETCNQKVCNICVIGVSKGELGEDWAEAISEELPTENFPKLMK